MVLTRSVRCVNLDWLEVYCLEPIESARDAEYFRVAGYTVMERDYGTRVYNQMFTIMGSDGQPLLEVRREPKSANERGGILPINATHIRLHNRTCYYDDAAVKLKEFLHVHRYTNVRISRVDVCLDFERFDSGDYPARFLRRYLKEVYAKINQANVHNHGEDGWLCRKWYSISWGSPKSQVSTKFYCKSKELREVHDKPYIRQAWFTCGLVDDQMKLTKRGSDGVEYTPEIWRVEFSIRSGVKNWFVIEQDGNAKKKRSIRNTLDMYSGRLQILAVFASLTSHYFRFKEVRREQQRIRDAQLPQYGAATVAIRTAGNAYNDLSECIPRKDRCKDKVLFKWRANECVYHVEHVASVAKPQTDLDRLAAKLSDYAAAHPAKDIRSAVDVILRSILDDRQRLELAEPWNHAELLAMRAAFEYRKKHNSVDNAAIVSSLREFIAQFSGEIF